MDPVSEVARAIKRLTYSQMMELAQSLVDVRSETQDDTGFGPDDVAALLDSWADARIEGDKEVAHNEAIAAKAA